MNLKSIWDESRAFVIGRVTAGATYVVGGLTTAGGAAKAATDAQVAPAWLHSVSVDTMVLILGAIVTVATGLVSIWAKRRDTKFKQQKNEREQATWVMLMLRENGEDAMVAELGRNWRNRYGTARRDTDMGGLDA